MKAYKRALLYIGRKKGRSAMLFGVMWVCVLSMLVAGTVRNQTDVVVGQLKEKLSGYFTIVPNRDAENSSEFLTDEFCREVMKGENLSTYNGNDVYYMNVPELVLTPGMFTSQGAENEAHAARFVSCTDSFYSEQFYMGELELTEGEHIQAEDEGEALVSETLAKENHLKIGDTFISRVTEGYQGLDDDALGESFKHRVKGIYRVKTPSEDNGMKAECNIPDNYIFIDTKTDRDVMTKLRGEDVDWYRYGVNFYIRDSAQFEETLEDVERKITLPSEAYRIEQNNGKYQQSAQPLEKLIQMMGIFITAVLILGAVILCLILIMWMKDRKREIGVYLEVGIEKRNILIQLLLESILIYLVSFLVAVPCAAVMMSNVKHMLFGKEMLETIGMKEAIAMGLGPKDILMVLVIGTILIGLAVLVSYMNVVRMNPKDILSSNE